MKGYCLATASTLTDNPIGDMRELSAQTYHILRFIIHMCLYLACDNGDVEKLVTLEASKRIADKKQFFWEHMQKDLKLGSKALNVNSDELIILLHYICDNLKNSIAAEPVITGQEIRWVTKAERLEWENKFSSSYLSVYLKNTVKFRNQANQALQENDKNEKKSDQSKKLYFMAYEVVPELPETESHIYENSSLWRYLPTVNLDLIKAELASKTENDQFGMLKKFIEMVNFL